MRRPSQEIVWPFAEFDLIVRAVIVIPEFLFRHIISHAEQHLSTFQIIEILQFDVECKSVPTGVFVWSSRVLNIVEGCRYFRYRLPVIECESDSHPFVER